MLLWVVFWGWSVSVLERECFCWVGSVCWGESVCYLSLCGYLEFVMERKYKLGR